MKIFDRWFYVFAASMRSHERELYSRSRSNPSPPPPPPTLAIQWPVGVRDVWSALRKKLVTVKLSLLYRYLGSNHLSELKEGLFSRNHELDYL